MKSFFARYTRPGLIVLGAVAVLGVVIYLILQKPGSTSEPRAERIETPAMLASPIKVTTSHEGMYQLNLEDIGFKGASENGATHPTIELSNNGLRQLIWFDEKSNSLQFYAQPSVSRYTNENVYWLSSQPLDGINSGGAAAGSNPEPDRIDSHSTEDSRIASLAANSYAARIHLEENLVYNPLATEGDRWFWALLPAPVKKDFSFDLQRITPSPGKLRLLVWGSTEAPTSPDHHLVLWLNDTQITDDDWDGKGKHLVEADLQPGILVEGQNQLEIELPGDTQAAADIVYLDWVEIIYPSPLIADSDRLGFVSPGGMIQMQGFSGPVEIYDVTDPDNVVRLAESVDAGAGFDSEKGRRYWVVGPSGYLEPQNLQPVTLLPDLLSSENAIDYIAIGPPELLAPLQPLLELRERQGLKSLAIPIQAVYDQFSYGQSDPEAIRSLLQYARQNWTRTPKYLALVGDASYDPKGYITPPEANQLPTFFVQTYHGGETASDYGFSLPGDTPWQPDKNTQESSPDIAVGRIPARTAEQVSAYADKVISYEQDGGTFNPANPWQEHILTVADGSEAYFKNDAENFLSRFNRGYQTELLAPLNGEQGFNQTIIQKINQGSWLVAYFGHGSINLWGRDRLFTTQDVPSLENGDRLPVILNFTCLTGLFTHPKETSLAEAFLWQPKGGAIAVLAPTSLTLTQDQSYLSDAIAEEMMNINGARLGDLLTHARRRILSENPSDTDVLFTYLLFGDPALKLAQPVSP
jgi:hypothetical protein